LLALLGLTPEVLPADIDESVRPGEHAVAYVERLAREKAEAVAALRPDAWVIGADTTVSLGDDVIAKPESVEEAVAMLTRLQGKGHVVHTGMAVTGGGRTVSGVETTRVWMRALDERTIRSYIATGEPMDKAGAYGIQGYGAVIVERIDGDYFTVMGLGLGRLVGLLRESGLDYAFSASLTLSKTSPTEIRSILS
jgi:septum formation protein